MAFVEQEVGEAAALGRVEVPQGLVQMIANLDDPRFLRRWGVAGRCDACRTGVAHVGSEERFIGFPQRQPRPGSAALPGTDGGQ